MSNLTVHVENIGKRYRIGGPKEPYGTLRDSIVSKVQAPMKRMRGRKEFGADEFWALRDVSFNLKHGEVLGIIGRNGAGKSTLLKILSRITEPTTGRARIHGQVGSLLEVGTGFHPELTGRENIFLNGAVLGMSKRNIDKHFDEIVAFAEIAQFLDTPVKRYSSGMYTRLAFSVAAHLDPGVLIVDEVLAVGDAAFQRKCLGKMNDVSKSGKTVLFVSHNLASVQSLCNTAILLEEGRLISSGNVSDVVNTYLGLDEQQRGRADLAGQRSRSGNGRARYTRARLLNHDGNVVSAIQSGRAFAVELTFTCVEPILRPVFGVVLFSSMKQRISTWRTKELRKDIGAAANGGTVTLAIEGLHLFPGNYTLGGTISDGVAWIDNVSDALRFEVTPNPEIEGSPDDSGLGIVYAPCHWSLDFE